MQKIVTTGAAAPIQSFQPLTKHAGQAERVDHLAVISAGFKGDKGQPVRSKDGTIYISDPEGRAEGLKAILDAAGGKKLTIAMPSNDPRTFIHQSYRKEGRSRLEAYGDDRGITVIGEDGGRRFHAAGSPEFERLKADCKITTNITFLLADYDEQGQPVLVFPDGLGAYRLRTSSPNSLGNLLSCLKQIAAFTGGHFAGFPLEVSLVYRNLTDPNGQKRDVPLFTFAMKPPRTIKMLSSQTFGVIAQGAQQAMNMAALALPAAEETLEDALASYEPIGATYDPERYRQAFFAIAAGTPLADADMRAEFIREHTDGATASLKAFLASATQAEADALLDAARAAVDGQDDAITTTAEPVLVPEVLPPDLDDMAAWPDAR